MWGNWGACSETCGPGTETRTRTVITKASCGGSCSPGSEVRKCSIACCPVDCSVGDWTSWTPSSVPCGTTIDQTRERKIVVDASCGGAACPALKETQKKSGPCCPQDCQFTWGSWSACSNSCGKGTRTRKVTVTANLVCGGQACPTDETENCIGEVNVNCQVRRRSLIQIFSKSCIILGRSVVRLRALSTDQSSVRFGNDDSNSSSDRCAEVQRQRLSLVGRFGPMQHVLPRQLRRRRLGRVVRLLFERLQFGKEVGSTPMIRFEQVIDFRFSIRSRSTTTSPSCGGNPCPALSESKDCTGLQRIDCVMGPWSTWSSCSNRCGAGQEKRYRGVTQSAQCGGASCGSSDASRPCTSYADDRDCTVRPESIFQ